MEKDFMLDSLNEELNLELEVTELVEELSERAEFGCTGNACGANATICGAYAGA